MFSMSNDPNLSPRVAVEPFFVKEEDLFFFGLFLPEDDQQQQPSTGGKNFHSSLSSADCADGHACRSQNNSRDNGQPQQLCQR